MSLRKARQIRRQKNLGFALIEVMLAMVILTVGLLGLAALLAQLTGTTTQSRYLGAEVMFASEKLEDLNQLDYKGYKDTLLAATAFTDPAAADAAHTDTVQMSSRSGMINDLDTQGNTQTDMISFKRTWVIEPNVPNVGVERITVLVSPTTGTVVEKGEKYQASSIRPCDAQGGC